MCAWIQVESFSSTKITDSWLWILGSSLQPVHIGLPNWSKDLQRVQYFMCYFLTHLYVVLPSTIKREVPNGYMYLLRLTLQSTFSVEPLITADDRMAFSVGLATCRPLFVAVSVIGYFYKNRLSQIPSCVRNHLSSNATGSESIILSARPFIDM